MAIFYDTNPNTAVISGVTAVLNTPVTKRISGVYYMDTGTTWDFGIGDIDYINDATYPLHFIDVDSSPLGVNDFFLTSADLTGWTSDDNNTNASWSDTLAINMASFRVCGGSSVFRARPIDWVAEAYSNAVALDVLIDTYADNATNNAISITEEFNGESERCTSACVAWNSATFLAADELLVHCGLLKKQQIDFTSYLPHNGTTIINPDYTASGGASQYYYRTYVTDGTVRSGGTFTFNGIVEGDLGGNIFIDISLDGIAWYDCTSDYLGGALVNGAGCRTNSGTITLPSLEFTLGSFTTNNAVPPLPAQSILLRITIPSGSLAELDTANMIWKT